MIITAVERKRGRRRVEVYVDGRFALAMGTKLAAERAVRPGRAITPGELSALTEEEARRGAMEAAGRLLAYRLRSEQELRDRLRRKGFASEVIGETLRRLRELGYVDDEAFARLWAETRQAARPRSARLLAVELRRKGVAPEAVEQATEGISEDDAAYDAATRRFKALRKLEYRAFRERLGKFLTSRGFAYDTARRVVERCWSEVGQQSSDSAGI